MTEAEKEQTKLFANSLDRAGTSCLTVGVFAPIAAALYGNGTFFTSGPWVIVICAVCWLLAAFVLDIEAQRVIGRLK
jgi:hypothetical protein